jgi:hypothetical protein
MSSTLFHRTTGSIPRAESIAPDYSSMEYTCRNTTLTRRLALESVDGREQYVSRADWSKAVVSLTAAGPV